MRIESGPKQWENVRFLNVFDTFHIHIAEVLYIELRTFPGSDLTLVVGSYSISPASFYVAAGCHSGRETSGKRHETRTFIHFLG